MKTLAVFYGLLLTCTNFIFSQAWKDSLQEARNLYKNANYEQALKKYQATKKITPKNVDISNELAQSAYKAGDFPMAEKSYANGKFNYANKYNKAANLHNLGNSYLKQKKYDDAIQAYKQALRNKPNDEETRYNLAKALQQQKQNQKQQNQQQQNQQKNKQANPPKEKEADKKDKEKPSDPSQQKNQKNETSSKLNDNKTERMLDDLVKKEIETKKKMDKSKGAGTTSNSGIDW